MIKIILSVLLFCILNIDTMAQNPGPNVSWQRCYGTTGNDYINSIKPIKSGQYFIATSFFLNKNNFLANSNDTGSFVLVFDTNFNLIKKTYIPIFATHIIEQTDGKILLAGTLKKYWDRYNVFQNTPDNSPTAGDFAIIKLDSTLTNIVWAKAYGSTGQETYLVDIITLPDNSIIFTGTTRGNNVDIPDNSPCFNPFQENTVIFKIDSLGNKQWVKVFGGDGAEGPLGNIIKYNDNLFRVDIKSSSDNCDYAGTAPFSNSGIFKTQIILFDSNGNIIKRKIDDDGKDLTWKSAGWRRNGKTYIIGSASAETALHPTFPSHEGLEFGIAIYDDSLNLIDMKVWGGKGRDFLSNYIQKSENEYYFWGQTTSSDNQGDVKNYKGGYADYWLMKTDSNFNIIWSKTIGSTGMDANLYEKFPTSGMLINNSELIVVDLIYPPQTLPDGDVNCGIFSELVPGAQMSDGWIVSFDLTTGIEFIPNTSSSHIKLYPNPANNIINFENTKPTNSKIKISITNSIGEILIEKDELIDNGFNTINISGLNSGIYTLTISRKKKILTVQKFIVN